MGIALAVRHVKKLHFEEGGRFTVVDLDRHLMHEKCGAVLEIDLRKYFDTIPHKPLERLLRLKIKDERFLRLILKLLKAPILNSEGVAERNEVGSPQGSIISPILANIYLHYVVDIWFSWVSQKKYGGSARMVRYADDAVFIFRRSGDQYLHRRPDAYRVAVRRKQAAYHRYIQLGLIAQGVLQCLAVTRPALVWKSFGSWLCTIRPDLPPSELVVMAALRNALPEFKFSRQNIST